MDIFQFQDLVKKYLADETTSEENSELSRLLRNPVYVEMLANYMDNQLSGDEVVEEDYSDVINRIKQKLAQETGADVKQPQRVRFISTRWWAAAAVILVVLVAGYLMKQQLGIDNADEQVNGIVTNDILPGGNKAVLILDDGSRVVLDSTGSGLIAVEGAVKVFQQSGSELSYEASAEEVDRIRFNTVQTPRGGQYQVTLPDGTKVWLNSLSSLRFPTQFTGATRDVEVSGEVYFEVARNEKMPFFVNVGDMAVKVLGTHFNINAYSDEDVIKTTLLEGIVEVTNRGRSVTLKPGEQASLQLPDAKLRTISGVNIEQVMAWKEGRFYFEDADIQAVMKELVKWYDVDVIYQGRIPSRKFGGKIQRSLTLSQILKLLSQNEINYTIIGKQLIIQAKEN